MTTFQQALYSCTKQIDMRTLKQCFVLLLITISRQTVFAQQQLNAVETILHEASIPAISLAYIKDGSLHEQYNIGVKSAESKEPVNDSTVFAACSLSKSVFSYAV